MDEESAPVQVLIVFTSSPRTGGTLVDDVADVAHDSAKVVAVVKEYVRGDRSSSIISSLIAADMSKKTKRCERSHRHTHNPVDT